MDGSNINGIELVVPREFLGILPLSPHPLYFSYDRTPFLGLKLMACPESIVFDIGSSYGVTTCLISKLVGSAGKVFSFEATSSVINKAQGLANVNNINNIIFINRFIPVIPGTRSVTSSRNPNIL